MTDEEVVLPVERDGSEQTLADHVAGLDADVAEEPSARLCRDGSRESARRGTQQLLMQTGGASPEVADAGYAANIDLAVRANFTCS
jgi:hypothetical protein